MPNSGAAGAIAKDEGAAPAEPAEPVEPAEPEDDALPMEFDRVATGTRCGAMREPAPDNESENECGAETAVDAAVPWPVLSEPLLLKEAAAEEDEEEGPCEVEKRAADAERAATSAADVDAEKEPPVVVGCCCC